MCPHIRLGARAPRAPPLRRECARADGDPTRTRDTRQARHLPLSDAGFPDPRRLPRLRAVPADHTGLPRQSGTQRADPRRAADRSAARLRSGDPALPRGRLRQCRGGRREPEQACSARSPPRPRHRGPSRRADPAHEPRLPRHGRRAPRRGSRDPALRLGPPHPARPPRHVLGSHRYLERSGLGHPHHARRR